MKKNAVLLLLAILIGLALTASQVFAAPSVDIAKKTPPPSAPGAPADQPGNKPAVPPGQVGKDDKGNPNKPGDDKPGLGPKDKDANPNKPDGKPVKPVNFRGKITAITSVEGVTTLTLALTKGGEAVVQMDEHTAIHVPTHSWDGTADYLGEGVEVTVKAHLVKGEAGAEDYFLADTIHVIPVTPLHQYYTGLITAVPVDWTAPVLLLTVGDKVFDITGAPIMPALVEGDTLQVGDQVTVVYTVLEDGTLKAQAVVVRVHTAPEEPPAAP